VTDYILGIPVFIDELGEYANQQMVGSRVNLRVSATSFDDAAKRLGDALQRILVILAPKGEPQMQLLLLRCKHVQSGEAVAGSVHINADAYATRREGFASRAHDDIVSLCPDCLARVIALAVELQA